MQYLILNLGDPMSNDKNRTETPVQNITSMPVEGVPTAPVEKQPNVIVRAFRKIKNTPPKTALAVVGGVALVAAGAVAGRKTAPLHLEVVDSNLELEPVFQTPYSADSDADTTSA